MRGDRNPLDQRRLGDMTLRVGQVLSSKSGGYVWVDLVGGNVELPVLRDYSPTVGDQCLVFGRGTQAYVLGALGTGPPAPYVPDPEDDYLPPVPALDPDHGSTLFTPSYVNTYRGIGWRFVPDLYQGDPNGAGLNYGVAFYGTGLSGLGAITVVGLALTVRRLPAGSRERLAPTFRLLSATAPFGDPALMELDSHVGPAMLVGETVEVDLPTSWGTDMSNGDAGGIGIYVPTDSPYVRLDGTTMALRMDWTR